MKWTYCFIVMYVATHVLSSCGTATSEKEKITAASLATDTISVKLELITNRIESPIEYHVNPGAPDRAYVTETQGKIWIMDHDSLLPRPFFNIYDKLGPQDPRTAIGVVSGVAFHPGYASNGKFYVSYNAPSNVKGNPGTLVIAEFTRDSANQDLSDLHSERRILEIEGKNIIANGSQIAFGPDGYLYISIGDDAIGDSLYVYKAQDLKHLNGKLLRIDINQTPYGIPADNPFVGDKNARPEIWAYGFRKIWRFAFEPGTSSLFGADVGEVKQEEIDVITKGGNYGWPHDEGDSIFLSTAQMQGASNRPIFSYPRNVGICIIGGVFYDGSGIPRMTGRYLFADLSGKMLALAKEGSGRWVMQPVRILGLPEGNFLICGFGVDEQGEPIVMGFLATKEGQKGVVYKVLRA
jgi:glucose/arabinose dehydrogenase